MKSQAKTNPNTSDAATENLLGPRKAAIMMAMLGEDKASHVLRQLNEEEVKALSREITEVDHVAPEEAEGVLEEFHRLHLARSYAAAGGIDYAHRLLHKAFGPEAAKRLTESLKSVQTGLTSFDQIGQSDPQQLCNLLQGESAQTIALVIAHLDPSAAGATFSQLPDTVKTDVALRLAGLQGVPEEVVHRVSSTLGKRLSTSSRQKVKTLGGASAVAELFNHLDRAQGRQILDEIAESDPDLALQVRNLMVTFDDILLVEDAGIREVVSRVDKKVLGLALKGTSQALQDRFYNNMSQRAGEMMREEMEYLGPVKLKDVNAAQQEIIEILRTLDEEGIITLKGGGSAEEQYVT